MRSQSLSAVFLCVATSLVLSGCGGGGGGSKPVVTPTTYPASGAYGWVLKASGPTGALKKGLSLVHPGQPDAEFVIEAANDYVSDAMLVSRGSVNAGALQVTSVQADALVYIRGGDVRWVPMQANGQSPVSQRISAGSTSACSFVSDLAANDHATPVNSRFIVTTAGADGICGGPTSDDGLAEVRKDASLGLVFKPISAGAEPLAVVRDPATLAPRGWLYSRTVGLWNGAASTPFTVRASDKPALVSVVGSTYRQALVSDGTQLSVIDFSGGTGYTETLLDAGITAGNRWKLIGFDTDNFYVYDNSPLNDFSTPWTILKITRTTPVASVLASGTGLIQAASMGSGVLYLTVASAIDNQRVIVNKSTGTATTDSFPSNVFVSVQTGGNGIHQMWIVTGVATSQMTYTLLLIDETDAVLHQAAGGFPMAAAEASTLSFNTSESRTSFVFASDVTVDKQFNGATLETFDTMSSVHRVLGALPGAATLGTDSGFASAVAGPSTHGAVYAARSVGGEVQASGSKVYSYDLGTANSLIAKTRVVN